MEEKLQALAKSLNSTQEVVRMLNCKVEVLEYLLERHAPKAFEEFHFHLYDLLQEQIALGHFSNFDFVPKGLDETSHD